MTIRISITSDKVHEGKTVMAALIAAAVRAKFPELTIEVEALEPDFRTKLDRLAEGGTFNLTTEAVQIQDLNGHAVDEARHSFILQGERIHASSEALDEVFDRTA